MKKILISFCILPFLLVSCDRLGTGKVKSIIDLTTQLAAETDEQVNLLLGKDEVIMSAKPGKYTLAKNTIISNLAVAKNVIYTVDNRGYVAAFSTEKKKIIWSVDTASDLRDRDFSSGGILCSDGKLYVTNGTRNLIIIDAKTGFEIVRKEFPDILRTKPALVANNIAVVQTISNQLFAYDVSASKIVWTHEGGTETISAQNNIAPIVYNEGVLASYSSGELVFLDAHSGKERWVINLIDTGAVSIPSFDLALITTMPIINQNNIYFATSNGRVMKVDAVSGAVHWSRKAEDVQSISLIGDNIFVTNNARQVAAISIYNGRIKWVGALISAKDRAAKKPKAIISQAPFVTKTADAGIPVLNVIGSDGELYQFIQDEKGKLPVQPNIIKIPSGVNDRWISCCSKILHMVTKKDIIF